MKNKAASIFHAGQVTSHRPCRRSHHLPLLLQDDGLPRPLPQAQGLVVGRRHDVVAVGADGQTPDLAVVTLRGGGEKPRVSASAKDNVPFASQGDNGFPCYNKRRK